MLVNAENFPIDFRREIAEDRVGGGMYVQSGRDQHEQGFCGEISRPGK